MDSQLSVIIEILYCLTLTAILASHHHHDYHHSTS